MAQTRQIGPNKFITVDRSWHDNGKDAQYALVGGSKVLISASEKAQPAINQYGKEFFYDDGSPITNPQHVDHLPEPFKTTALKYISDSKDKAPLPVYESKEKAVEATVAPKKGPGRPKKVEAPKKKVLEIKDEADFVKHGGTVV